MVGITGRTAIPIPNHYEWYRGTGEYGFETESSTWVDFYFWLRGLGSGSLFLLATRIATVQYMASSNGA